MVTGKVLRFDTARGYGFIAPNTGGEDVFLHVNDLSFGEERVHPGVMLEFEIVEGDRGPKAAFVRLSADNPPQAATHAVARHVDPQDGDCDVLSRDEYQREVTELLLRTVPTLSGTDILTIRAALVNSAQAHGWIED
ncbi:cold shock domain-containing protein [Streptomyces sp. NPDC001941]|uniref:cold-shock protein n=1 Tax=Streptomyces sp. NPDC001941 TaxID=3154659 RepID=UPI00332684C5